MRSRHQVSAMKAILRVRRLQELTAEMAAAKGAEELRAAQGRRDESAEQLAADQADWARAMADKSLGLSVAGLWAGQVARSEAALTAASSDVASAEQQKQARLDEWRAALARSDATGDLATMIFRGARRAQEEKKLSELADRTSRGSFAR